MPQLKDAQKTLAVTESTASYAKGFVGIIISLTVKSTLKITYLTHLPY
jgi:hypothetical protein